MSKKEQLFRENYNLGYVYSTTLNTGHMVFIKAMKSNTECPIDKAEHMCCPKFLKNAKTVYEKVCTYHSNEEGFEKYYAEVLCGKWNLLKPLSVVKNTGKYFIHDDSISPRNVYKELFEDELFSLLQGKEFGLTDSFDTEYKVLYKDKEGSVLPSPTTELEFIEYKEKGFEIQYKQFLSLHRIIRIGYKVLYKDKEGSVLPSPTTELEFIEYKEKGFEIQYKQFLSLHRIIRIGEYLVMFAVFPPIEELENAYEGKLKDSRASIDGNEYLGLVLEFCGCPSHTITNKYRIRKAGKDGNGKKHKGSKFTPIQLLGHNIQADLYFLRMPEITFFDYKTGKQVSKDEYKNAQFRQDFIRYLVGLNGGLETMTAGDLIIEYNGRCYPITLSVRDTMNHSVTRNKSLAELGEVCGFEKDKMENEEIQNMNKVLFDNMPKYLHYADIDPQIPHNYVSSMYGMNKQVKMTFLSAVVPIIVEKMKQYFLEKLDIISWLEYFIKYVSSMYGMNKQVKMTFLSAVVPIIVEKMKQYFLEKLDIISWLEYFIKNKIKMKFFELETHEFTAFSPKELYKHFPQNRLLYTQDKGVIIKSIDGKSAEWVIKFVNGLAKQYKIKTMTDDLFQAIYQGVIDKNGNRSFVTEHASKTCAVFMSKLKVFFGLESDHMTDLSTEAYHGGMNDCRYIGVYEKETRDLDLKSAYMTSERLIPLPDWRQPYVEILTYNKTKDERWKTFSNELGNGMEIFEPYRNYNNGEIPMELVASTVIEIAGWKHPQEQVRCQDGVLWSTVPFIPFAHEGTIGYAEEHQSGWNGVASMTITGTEYIKTIEEGGEVYVTRAYLINPLRDKEGNILHVIGDIAQHFIGLRETSQKMYGKKTLPDLLIKELNNGGLYGKIAQNVTKKSVYDPKTPQGLEITEETIDKGASPLTNPFVVCNITASIRCMLTASHNAMVRHGLGGFLQITTDGGNAPVDDKTINALDTGFVGELFRKSRLEITHGENDNIYEVKAVNENSLTITTRRNLSLTEGGITALTGYKSLYKKGTKEQKYEFIRKFISNEPVVSVNSYAKGCLPNAQKKFEKNIPYDSIKVSYGNSNYDFKFKPVIDEMKDMHFEQYEAETGMECVVGTCPTKPWSTTNELANAISYMHNHKYFLVRLTKDYEGVLTSIGLYGSGYTSKRARARGEVTDVLLCFVSAMYGRFSECFVQGFYDMTRKQQVELLNEKFMLREEECITYNDIRSARSRVAPMPSYYQPQIPFIKEILEKK